LWWRSLGHADQWEVDRLAFSPALSRAGVSYLGYISVAVVPTSTSVVKNGWRFKSEQVDSEHASSVRNAIESSGRFGTSDTGVYFPLWYPALIFAIAAVAALRLRRQFSISSTLAAVSIVAVLLGMVVAL
jgi:hypothetical protein